jgi:transcriptional regulator with XRE-family HTH domain
MIFCGSRTNGARGMSRVKRLVRRAELDALADEPAAGRRGPSEVNALVGRRLREARLLAGPSQCRLGARIGVTFQAAQKYESGENRLSASRLLTVAELLRQPISFFFDLSDGAQRVEAAGLTAKEIKLLRYYHRIGTEEARDRMLKLAKRLGSGSGPGQGASKSL